MSVAGGRRAVEYMWRSTAVHIRLSTGGACARLWYHSARSLSQGPVRGAGRTMLLGAGRGSGAHRCSIAALSTTASFCLLRAQDHDSSSSRTVVPVPGTRASGRVSAGHGHRFLSITVQDRPRGRPDRPYPGSRWPYSFKVKITTWD